MTDVNKPPVVSRREWLALIDTLRAREKAHTREGDAIAAARRRLPMTEVDPSTPLVGGDGQVPLIDVFDATSPSRPSARGPSTSPTATAASWAGRCPGTPCPPNPTNGSSPVAPSA